MASFIFGGERPGSDFVDDISDIFYNRTGETPSIYSEGETFLLSSNSCIDQGELKVAFNGYIIDSDTEPEEKIASAYREHGPDFVEHLDGQFRFILYDTEKDRFHTSSGKAGRKVVYYTDAGDDFMCSSHLTPLLRHPGIEPEINRTGVSHFLQSWSASFGGGERLVKDVYRLYPSHQLTYSGGEISEEMYWEVYGEKRSVSDREAVERMDELLTEGAEKLVEQVEGPLNVLLSGGFDSTFLVALLREVTDRPIHTYTWGWNDEHFEAGREMADRYGTRHSEIWNQYEFPTDEDMRFYEEPQNLFVRYPFPELYRDHGVQNFWTGLNSQATFPVCLGDVRRLDRMRYLEAPLERMTTRKLKRLVASKVDYKAAKAIEVLESDHHSTAAVIDWSLLRDDSDRLLSDELKKEGGELGEHLDRIWDLSRNSYQENYNYLQLRARDTARYAYYAQDFEHFDLYGYIPLLEYSYSLPMSQKKNRRLLQKIARGRVPEKVITKGASGWGFVNDQLRKTLRANEEDYRRNVNQFIERGFMNERFARKLLLPERFEPQGGGRGIISQMIAVYLLERWMKLFIDRDEPWKPL